MRGRALEWAVLTALAIVLIGLALASGGSAPSTYSSFDTGPNGYRALYGVLAREDVPVARLEAPLARLPADAGVLVMTPPLPAFRTRLPIVLSANDRKRIEAFVHRGGTVLAFGAVTGLTASPRVHVLDVASDTNAALAAHPRNALAVYRAVAGRGTVVFDEYLHGYDRTQSLWSVLPRSVRVACALAGIALVLGLIDANVRFAPPLRIEPPDDRDSSDYLRSMARLLRRARAGQAAIARFSRALPDDAELAALAERPRPSDALVLRAAALYGTRRKERA